MNAKAKEKPTTKTELIALTSLFTLREGKQKDIKVGDTFKVRSDEAKVLISLNYAKLAN